MSLDHTRSIVIQKNSLILAIFNLLALVSSYLSIRNISCIYWIGLLYPDTPDDRRSGDVVEVD